MPAKMPPKFILYLRAVLFWISFATVTTVIGTVVVLVRLISAEVSLRVGKLWGYLVVKLLKLICKVDYEITGLENIVKSNNAIVFCKHQSTWETAFLHTIIPYGRWVFKRELLFIPIFGWALAATNPISLNRKAGRAAVKQLVSEGVQRLKRGKWIILFPEGTRSQPGKPSDYKIGGAILAEKSEYPVLPIAHNAGEYWPRGSMIKWPGTIRVVIGPLIETKGKNSKQILEESKSWIENTMKEISCPEHWHRHPEGYKLADSSD